MKAQIKAITNNKGGCGKTTTTLTMAQLIAKKNRKVLIIDLDAQGNISKQLMNTQDYNELNGNTSYELITGSAHINDCIKKYKSDHLEIDLIPATQELTKSIFYIISTCADVNPTLRLKKAIKPVIEDYDMILIDLASEFNVLTSNAFNVADGILIPILADAYSYEGVSKVIEQVNNIKEDSNGNLKIDGIFLNCYSNDSINNEVKTEFKQIESFLDTTIPRAVEIPKNTAQNFLITEVKTINKQIIPSYNSLIHELGWL